MQTHLLHHLAQLLQDRLRIFFQEEDRAPVFSLNGEASLLNHAVNHSNLGVPYELSKEEQIVLLLAYASHLQPSFLDQIIATHIPNSGDFPQLGGTKGKAYRGFLPTGQTALFLLAGDDLEQQLKYQYLFSEDHFFAKRYILWLEDVPKGEPRMSGKIILSQEYIDLLNTGKVARPKFGIQFPAQLLETQMEWEDLVLNSNTLVQVRELETWVKYGNQLLNEWGMKKRIKPGFRTLFYGAPGTGKTLTASLLGKYTNKDVYRIDLSMVVSKFIGETEKNLSNLFAKAEHKDWILFFDEADALFGKRTNVKDAHDKYANQEVAYLLQRVEAYNGLVILASNRKNDIDEAFLRRFQSIIHFPFPKATERKRLWENAFPKTIKLKIEADFTTLAQRYELTGASIMNAIQYACLRTLEQGDWVIKLDYIIKGIEKEYLKEGRMLP
ncbi:MAG: ATP-binding protein [Bacteroidota bacterium]